MQTLSSYVCGAWVAGNGKAVQLHNPTTEAVVAEVKEGGVDYRAAVAYARSKGGPALRAMSFGARAAALKQLSALLHAKRDELIEISIKNGGTTRGDAKFDLDGATGALAAYAMWGEPLGDRKFLTDGDVVQLGRSAHWSGRHVLTPRLGVAVHINAFNFPAWNMMEKAACALLAGVPVIEKPGTPTALLAFRIAELVVESKILPEGAFQFVLAAGDLLDHLDGQDALAFTGSSATAALLRGHPNVVKKSVRATFEADSVNATVLGPDVGAGDDLLHAFVNSVVTEATQKAGQKCTATRRVFVPTALLGEVETRIVDGLRAVKIGDPAGDARLGPVASARQFADVRAGIGRFAAAGLRIATGGLDRPLPTGWFVAPTLFAAPHADVAIMHAEEVFGPVTTLIPYGGTAAEAAALVGRGEGSLVTGLCSNDADWLTEAILGVAPWTGRVWTINDKCADKSLPAGAVHPASIHGGPGRAGGGEELGGLRGLSIYLQRTAVQGYGPYLQQALG
jgi:oxepin-CoA hydrolase/3-oxo-5,6-dehydrosuberyl-CoA semialdehyde dehydrogenase